MGRAERTAAATPVHTGLAHREAHQAMKDGPNAAPGGWIVATVVVIAVCVPFLVLGVAGNFAHPSGSAGPAVFTVLPDLGPTASVEEARLASATAAPTLTPSTARPEDVVTRPTPDPTPGAAPPSVPTPTTFALEAPRLNGVTPTGPDTTPIPTPVPAVRVPPGAINIVVLGSDRRPDWSAWHTDAIQVVSIQPSLPAVTVLSIPRDLYVYIPGFWMSRINFADMYGELHGYEGGGPALVQQTMLYNLGIRIDHTVRVDFGGFRGIVDILGGVDIPVHCRLVDHWPYPDENGEYPIKVLEPGVHHMDGQTALWYARSRKTSSVFARERRQQQVLEAIWRQGRELDVLPRIPQLWGQYRSMVVTDMSLLEVLRLAEVAFRLDSQYVRLRSIGHEHVIPWTTPKGGYVFLPDWEKIEPLLAEALGPVPEARVWRAMQTVEVWNGTSNAGWDQLAADRLWREGFGVVIAEPDRRDYARTQLVDFTTLPQGSAAFDLQQMFRVASENVISAPDLGAPAQYRLMIGADYQTCPGP
jgi:LCP family protein required for cell wall assembly